MPRFDALYDWLDHWQTMGINTLYLGPLFESTAHGYDTADYLQVDRRLGSNETLARLAAELKRRGIRLILDGVFHHVGRDFWAFQNVIRQGERSAYRDWFAGLDFTRQSPYGDPFAYAGWAGHYDLVKLNLANPDVRRHLFDAVTSWVDRFDVDGLRLDAADRLDFDFMRALRQHCHTLKPDFWLMGEVVGGDYRRWANADLLDATTNYEAYKGLYSSHVDCNYFEIAYSLQREFGAEGIYRDLPLYNFADNHDVDRVASSLTNPAQLYPLYGLLLTMPGVPSIYYGSEWGIPGKRTPQSDKALRPALSIHDAAALPQPQLADTIERLAAIRRESPALRYGDYAQLHVAAEQFAFMRRSDGETVVVAVNAADHPATVALQGLSGSRLDDLLNPGNSFPIRDGAATVDLHPTWLRVMRVR